VPSATPEPATETTTPTAEATQNPPSSPPSTATQAPPAAELAILSFTVAVEEVPAGKRLTFRWQTTGAVRAIVWSGTRHRFPEAWAVPPNDTLTVELFSTTYRDPSMFLTA